MISPAMRVFSEKNASSNRSTGTTTKLQRADRAAPTMSMASRSLCNLSPVASHRRTRTPPSSVTVSVMASDSVGAAEKGDDLGGRGRNEMADVRVEVDFRLRQKIFRPMFRIRRIDQGIFAAQKDGDRHLEAHQVVVAGGRDRITPGREVPKDQTEKILDQF